ncbi:thioredoxin [Mariniblastus fucicola]|uniref:Thioredoxin n=2 Tax=Mariniblastus fucicola TaxID=980251 RepID=A0A5B9PDB1_9BACT|nr:thioredoxin [Mariniblastus fucicola]QEG24368.1 Thioredoxin [Mariniblastus fucicola]
MAAEFSGENFEAEVINSAKVALVDFYSDGCPPCRALAPLIDELSDELGDTATVGKVNVGNDMDLAMKYGISVVPTILVFKAGEVVERKTGALPKDQLQALIEQHA